MKQASRESDRSGGRSRLPRFVFVVLLSLALLAPLAPAPAHAASWGLAPRPRLTGTATNGGRLSVQTGIWAPKPDQFAYRWYRTDARGRETQIQGVGGRFYAPTAADVGSRIRVRVFARKAGYPVLAQWTQRSSVVTPAKFASAPAPTIYGSREVGNTLRVSMEGWSPAPASVSYRWYRVDAKGQAVVIPGAVRARYTLTQADAGQRIRVRVTASRNGYQTTSKVATVTIANRVMRWYDLTDIKGSAETRSGFVVRSSTMGSRYFPEALRPYYGSSYYYDSTTTETWTLNTRCTKFRVYPGADNTSEFSEQPSIFRVYLNDNQRAEWQVSKFQEPTLRELDISGTVSLKLYTHQRRQTSPVPIWGSPQVLCYQDPTS